MAKYLEGHLEELERTLLECSCLDYRDVVYWQRMIIEGDSFEAVATVLLCLLPNLTSVSFLGFFAIGFSFEHLLRNVCLTNELSLNSFPLRPGKPRKVLSRLADVHLACGVEHDVWRDGYSYLSILELCLAFDLSGAIAFVALFLIGKILPRYQRYRPLTSVIA